MNAYVVYQFYTLSDTGKKSLNLIQAYSNAGKNLREIIRNGDIFVLVHVDLYCVELCAKVRANLLQQWEGVRSFVF